MSSRSDVDWALAVDVLRVVAAMFIDDEPERVYVVEGPGPWPFSRFEEVPAGAIEVLRLRRQH